MLCVWDLILWVLWILLIAVGCLGCGFVFDLVLADLFAGLLGWFWV